MHTLVITTNPAGYTVSIFKEELTPFQVEEEYLKYYDDVFHYHYPETNPPAWYIKCMKAGQPDELYQIKWAPA